MLGRTLSHYEVLEEISRGGMGIVYRARDLKLNREVAFKVLPPKLVADPERKRRFVQEAQAAAALTHPNIATVYEIDSVDGMDFIAMELIDGENLSDLISGDGLTTARAVDIAIEAADGLARAHERGIVHRDLKPSNILLAADGHPKIIDFGLAKLVEADAGVTDDELTAVRGETHPGTVLGAFSYMSPEQARGGSVDARSDVFSFGIVLFQMLSGELPFQGETSADTLGAILKDPTPRANIKKGSSVLQPILAKCLAKDPSARYRNAGELVADLERARTKIAAPMPGRALVALAAVALVIAGSIWWMRSAPRSELPAASFGSRIPSKSRPRWESKKSHRGHRTGRCWRSRPANRATKSRYPRRPRTRTRTSGSHRRNPRRVLLRTATSP